MRVTHGCAGCLLKYDNVTTKERIKVKTGKSAAVYVVDKIGRVNRVIYEENTIPVKADCEKFVMEFMPSTLCFSRTEVSPKSSCARKNKG